MSKYIIASGYWASESQQARSGFFDIWWRNTESTCSPESVYIVNAASKLLPKNMRGNWINATENIGHVHHMILGQRGQKLSGWTISTLIGALIAYNCDSDMIYKEQDCLCFGNWIAQIYEAAGRTGTWMLFGQNDVMKIEQSLVWIKYDGLLEYVKMILNMSESDATKLPEAKYLQLIESGFAQYLPFGYGRNRPINYDNEAFYAQQITPGEIVELKKRGLIT